MLETPGPDAHRHHTHPGAGNRARGDTGHDRHGGPHRGAGPLARGDAHGCPDAISDPERHATGS